MLEKDKAGYLMGLGTSTHFPDLHDINDIAVSAAPRCIAVQHIAAFWNDNSRMEPETTNTSWDTSRKEGVQVTRSFTNYENKITSMFFFFFLGKDDGQRS